MIPFRMCGVRPDIRPELLRSSRSLAKDRNDRYQSAAEL
jgi:hypothetical protein